MDRNLLLNLKPKSFIKIIIINILIAMVIIFSFFIKISSIEKLKAMIICDKKCVLITEISYDKVTEVNNYFYLSLNDEAKQKFKILNIGEIKYDAVLKINYQEVLFDTFIDKKYQINNLVVDVKFFTNKEVLIKKIIKMFVERN